MGCLPQEALKDFSPKSQTLWALQQIKERGALPMIDRGDDPSGNRPLQQYRGFTAGRWLWLPGAQGRQPDCKIEKRAERSERLMYEQSHSRLSPLWLSAITVCLSWAVNHYRDNAITYKAQRDKNARELLANAAPRHADASA